VSDPVLYHNICACVKLSSTSTVGVEEIKSFCEQRFLPNLVSAYTPRPAFYL
ncbi:2-succinylbenzoate--CoA ligase, partial [Biomphalaria glabrata]